MNQESFEVLATLARTHRLSQHEYAFLLEHLTPLLAQRAAELARDCREPYYGHNVFIRGLIEISNHCKNDCYYCGIRKSNTKCERYRLSADDIFECAQTGYELGFRTFVLQGGEDAWFNDERLCAIIARIKNTFPYCAITLSLGERSRKSYQHLFDAGADRYLLRQETADASYYRSLHPQSMSYEQRMRCLYDLKDIGYTVGCGFMVGAPGQSSEHLASDLTFIQDFAPDMCGIGPFVPHHATRYAQYPTGSVELTCFLISLLRLMHPTLLLPATTALGTIDPLGREKGLEAGANVVMPNLSPVGVRKKYELYDNKICTGDESAQCRSCLQERLEAQGYHIVVDRGDPASPTSLIQKKEVAS